MNWSELKGRLVSYDRDGRRVGRVVRVYAGKRVGLRAVSVCGPCYLGADRWNWSGPKAKVEARNLIGVLYRRKIVPVDKFVAR